MKLMTCMMWYVLVCPLSYKKNSSYSSVYSSGLCTFEFKGHTIKASSKQMDKVSVLIKKFVSGVI